jgi:hypothetical protein
MIFFTQPSVILKTTLEDSFQFNKDFIRIHPPLAKGASAYILRQELAKDLANFIKTTSVKLPIDLLISYWAQKKNIKVYWQRNPVVREGSGNIYKSSLR